MTKDDRRNIKDKFRLWGLYGDTDIDNYMQTLDTYDRNFIRFRFKDRKSVIAISHMLYMSDRQLYRRQAKIFNGFYDWLISTKRIKARGV